MEKGSIFSIWDEQRKEESKNNKKIVIILKNENGKPISNTTCLIRNGNPSLIQTDEAGWAESNIPVNLDDTIIEFKHSGKTKTKLVELNRLGVTSLEILLSKT